MRVGLVTLGAIGLLPRFEGVSGPDTIVVHVVAGVPSRIAARRGRSRPPRAGDYLVGGGGGGGGTLSTETHAERSKKRYSSAFCCAVIGAPLQPFGMLLT